MTRNYGKQLDPAAAAIRDLHILRPYSRDPVSSDEVNYNRNEARPDMHFETKSLSQSFSSSVRRTTRKSFGWSQLVREIAEKQNQKPVAPQPQSQPNMLEQPKNAKLHLVELNSSSLHHKAPAATSTVSSRSAENTKNLPSGLSVVECPIGHKRLVGGAFRSSQQLVRCRHCEYLATIKRSNEDEQPESNEENGAADDASASKTRPTQSALSRARHNILELVLPELSSKGVKTASQTARSKSIMQRIVLRPPGKSEADDCPPDQKSLASQIDASLEGVIKSQSLVGSATKILRESNSRKSVVSTARSPQARSGRSLHNAHNDVSTSANGVEGGGHVHLDALRNGNSTPRNPYSKVQDASSNSRSTRLIDASDHADVIDNSSTYADRVVTSRRCVPIILPVREDTHEQDETRSHHEMRQHTEVRQREEDLQRQAEVEAEAEVEEAQQDLLPLESDAHACSCEDPIDEEPADPLACRQYSSHSEPNDSLEDELSASARAASVSYKNPFENMPLRMFTRLQDLRKMEAETIKLEEQNLWTLRQILKKKKKRK